MSAETVALQYLQHEFRKILADLGDPAWSAIDGSLKAFLEREDRGSFWNLVAGISDGWKLKSVHEILTDSKFEWTKQSIAINDVILTGMSPDIDRYAIKEADRDPLRFKAIWQSDGSARKAILATGLSAHAERDHLPIVVFENNDKWQVLDGMRRTLLAIIDDRKEIEAWVGKIVDPGGKPAFAPHYGMFIAKLYGRAASKDDELKASIKRINQEISNQYRDGAEQLRERIGGYSHNEEIKTLFDV